MFQVQVFTRKQRRKLVRLRRKAAAAACVLTLAGGSGLYSINGPMAGPCSVFAGREVVAEAATRDDIDGEFTKINIQDIDPNEDGICLVSINTEGTYLITGSNLRKDEGNQDVYVPTQIKVQNGVNAILYLENLSITNKDGNKDAGGSGSNPKATIPMLIKGNCEINLLSDVSFAVSESGNAMKVTETGFVSMESSSHKLTLDVSGNYKGGGFSAAQEDEPLYIQGNFQMNGSILELLTNVEETSAISLGEEKRIQGINQYEGTLTIKGGKINLPNLNPFKELNQAKKMEITGGQFSKSMDNDDVIPFSPDQSICIAPVEKLPENAKIEAVELFDYEGKFGFYYDAVDMSTDSNGSININVLNPAKINSNNGNQNFGAYFKIAGKWYQADCNYKSSDMRFYLSVQEENEQPKQKDNLYL